MNHYDLSCEHSYKNLRTLYIMCLLKITMMLTVTVLATKNLRFCCIKRIHRNKELSNIKYEGCSITNIFGCITSIQMCNKTG